MNDGVIPWWVRFCRWLWKHPLPFLWFTLIINVAINIGSTWLITPASTKTIPDTSIAGSITEWVSAHWLFSLLLGTISVALFLLTWQGSRWPESTPSASGQIQMSARDRERMLGRLHVRYEQMLAQSLQGTVLLELGLAESPASIQNAASLALHLPEQAEQILSPHTSIVDIYEQAHQELLILGKPGAGKSTLLIELALHLFKQAEQDAGQALPVLLPLSSWAVKRLPLQDWLIEQFASLYDVPQKLSELWIQADLLLPLLDGLDEMEEAIRPVCIAAINTYHREHLGPLVVCSRTTEYDRAATSGTIRAPYSRDGATTLPSSGHAANLCPRHTASRPTGCSEKECLPERTRNDSSDAPDPHLHLPGNSCERTAQQGEHPPTTHLERLCAAYGGAQRRCETLPTCQHSGMAGLARATDEETQSDHLLPGVPPTRLAFQEAKSLLSVEHWTVPRGGLRVGKWRIHWSDRWVGNWVDTWVVHKDSTCGRTHLVVGGPKI